MKLWQNTILVCEKQKGLLHRLNLPLSYERNFKTIMKYIFQIAEFVGTAFYYNEVIE